MGRVRSHNQMGQVDIEENFDRRTQKSLSKKIRTEVVFENCFHRGPLDYIVSQ